MGQKQRLFCDSWSRSASQLQQPLKENQKNLQMRFQIQTRDITKKYLVVVGTRPVYSQSQLRKWLACCSTAKGHESSGLGRRTRGKSTHILLPAGFLTKSMPNAVKFGRKHWAVWSAKCPLSPMNLHKVFQGYFDIVLMLLLWRKECFCKQPDAIQSWNTLLQCARSTRNFSGRCQDVSDRRAVGIRPAPAPEEMKKLSLAF